MLSREWLTASPLTSIMTTFLGKGCTVVIIRCGYPASCLSYLQPVELPDFNIRDWKWFVAEFGPLPECDPYVQQRWVLCEMRSGNTMRLARSGMQPGLTTLTARGGCHHLHSSAKAALYCRSAVDEGKIRKDTVESFSLDPSVGPRENTLWHLSLLGCVGGVWRMIDEFDNYAIVLY